MISVVSRATCGFGQTGATRDGGGGVQAIWADGGETWARRRDHGGGGVHAIWADGVETWRRQQGGGGKDQFGQTEKGRGGGGVGRRRRSCNLGRRSRDVAAAEGRRREFQGGEE